MECSEFLCGKHWRRIPLKLRRAYEQAKVKAAGRAYLDKEWRKPPRYLIAALDKPSISHEAYMRLWRRCKRAALDHSQLGDL